MRRSFITQAKSNPQTIELTISDVDGSVIDPEPPRCIELRRVVRRNPYGTPCDEIYYDSSHEDDNIVYSVVLEEE